MAALTTRQDEPSRANAAWHHRVAPAGKSCGFAADSALSQGTADTSNSNPEYRLSWHLGQTMGGHRAGTTVSLTNDQTWYKVVYFTSTNCNSLNDDYSVNLPGPPVGVQLNMPDTLAAKGMRNTPALRGLMHPVVCCGLTTGLVFVRRGWQAGRWCTTRYSVAQSPRQSAVCCVVPPPPHGHTPRPPPSSATHVLQQ